MDTLEKIGIIVGFIMSGLAFVNSLRNSVALNQSLDGGYVKTVNEAIALANTRALTAEERSNKLEKRVIVLENSLSYRLTFDVQLGTDPKIEHVIIEHYPERRSKEVVEVYQDNIERRRK